MKIETFRLTNYHPFSLMSNTTTRPNSYLRHEYRVAARASTRRQQIGGRNKN